MLLGSTPTDEKWYQEYIYNSIPLTIMCPDTAGATVVHVNIFLRSISKIDDYKMVSRGDIRNHLLKCNLFERYEISWKMVENVNDTKALNCK